MNEELRYCARKYDEFYSIPQARRENREIKRLFRAAFPSEPEWLDVGCGTGFGFTLIQNKKGYLGVDIDPNMIYVCTQKHSQGVFINEPAETQDFRTNVLSIFSLNYLPISEVVRLARESIKSFVVVYHKPYLVGSASAYRGKKDEYLLLHGNSYWHVRRLLLQNGFKVFSLLNEPYYYVGVKNGREEEGSTITGSAA